MGRRGKGGGTEARALRKREIGCDGGSEASAGRGESDLSSFLAILFSFFLSSADLGMAAGCWLGGFIQVQGHQSGFIRTQRIIGLYLICIVWMDDDGRR